MNEAIIIRSLRLAAEAVDNAAKLLSEIQEANESAKAEAAKGAEFHKYGGYEKLKTEPGVGVNGLGDILGTDEEVGDYVWAVASMQMGQKVRRMRWDREAYVVWVGDGNMVLHVPGMSSYKWVPSTEDILAIDWISSL